MTAAILLGGLVGGIVTAGSLPWLILALEQRGLVDTETDRTSHVGEVPRGGGIAIVVGMTAALLLTVNDWSGMPHVVTIVACVAGFTVLGLADDLESLPAGFRLAIQALIGMIAVGSLGIGGTNLVGLVMAAVALVWVVSFVNTFNFMDGVNGISAGTGIVLATSLGVTAIRWDIPGLALLSFALVGSVAGFLPFNAWAGRIFLGDVGSYLLGSTLAIIAMVEVAEGAPPVVVGLPFVVYTADVSFTLLRRARNHRPLLKSHREHAYQLLANDGWGHLGASALVVGLTALLGVVGQLAALSTAATAAAVVIGGLVVVAYLRLPTYS